MIIIKLYAGFNINELELLGSGTQGKVYKIDPQRCIKIFKRKEACKNEARSLVIAEGYSHFPVLYDYGKNYIIREYVDGVELNKYLLSHPLTPFISYEIIKLYEAMLSVGYRRLDSAIFHIYITPTEHIKLIDTAKAMKKKTTYPFLILKGLDELNYKEEFLDFVKVVRPNLYKKWLRHC